jgi:hypothetical protein
MKELYHKKNTFQQKLREQHKITIKIREEKIEKLENRQKEELEEKVKNKK